MPRQTIDLLKWLTRTLKFLTCSFLLLLFPIIVTLTTEWRNIAPGIEYQDLEGHFLTPWSHVHVFRINLKENKLSLVTAKDMVRPYASIEEYAVFSKALLAINGGFFDSHYKPLGLRINNKHQESPAKNISWWGIFYIKNQKPHLTNFTQFTLIGKLNSPYKAGLDF